MANKFVSGTLILTLSGFVVKAIGSVNWIILSRILGGEGIGIYQMAFPIYLLALEISSAGIPIAISIITAEKAARKDYGNAKRVFRVSLTLLMSAAVALSIIVYFASSLLIEYHLIRDSRAYYSLIALVPAIFFTTVIAGYRGYLQGWQQMTPTALSNCGTTCARGDYAGLCLLALTLRSRLCSWRCQFGCCYGRYFRLAGTLILLL